MTTDYTFLVAILSAIGGALLGGVTTALTARYAAFKESKGIAEALCADLTALLQVVDQRRYVDAIQGSITRLGDPHHTPTHTDAVSIRIGEDYFTVFNATVAKIGTLPTLSARIVKTYTLAKSLIEDVKELREIQKGAFKNEHELSRDGLLAMTREMLEMFLLVRHEADVTIKALKEYSSRRWLRIIP
jgi:hypothetical protein